MISATPAVSALRKILPTLNADRRLSKTSTIGFFAVSGSNGLDVLEVVSLSGDEVLLGPVGEAVLWNGKGRSLFLR